MKKISLLCFTALMGLSLAACGNNNSNKKATSSSTHSSGKVVKHHKKSSEESSSQVQQQSQQPQQATAQQSQTNSSNSADGKTVIAGHSFHRENFYGNSILVGDNGEGEAGEWAANNPATQNDPNVEAQLKSAYGN